MLTSVSLSICSIGVRRNFGVSKPMSADFSQVRHASDTIDAAVKLRLDLFQTPVRRLRLAASAAVRRRRSIQHRHRLMLDRSSVLGDRQRQPSADRGRPPVERPPRLGRTELRVTHRPGASRRRSMTAAATAADGAAGCGSCRASATALQPAHGIVAEDAADQTSAVDTDVVARAADKMGETAAETATEGAVDEEIRRRVHGDDDVVVIGQLASVWLQGLL